MNSRRSPDTHEGGCVDLSVGTPTDPTMPGVIAALASSNAERGYPASIGSVAYRRGAAAWMQRRFGITIDPGHLAACVGTKEFVALLPQLLHLRTPERDTILFPAVSYPTYSMGATLAGCRSVAVPLDDKWRLDISAISDDDARRALALWVNTPGNPAGGLDDLGAVAAWGRANDVPIFSDECYIEFTWAGAPRSILEHEAEGVVAVHSLSKRSNLAGARAGFYAGDPELVEYLSEVRKHMGLMVPGPVQSAAVAAFSDDAHVDAQRERYFRRLERAQQIMAAVGAPCDLPQGGFYLWALAPGGDAWGLARTLAARGGVLVSPGEFYGEAASEYVRVAVVQSGRCARARRSALGRELSMPLENPILPERDLLALTAELVDIPSVSHDEAAITDRIEQELRSFAHLEVTRMGNNLVARTQLGRKYRLVLGGHTDTVPVNDNAAARLEGDTLWGLGSADMKGGLAVMLELARSIVEPVIDVTFVFYECEEVASKFNGLRTIERERPELLSADVAILGEPTAVALEAGCQGTMRIVVTLRGSRAHTARAWMGRNAIHRMGELLAILAAYVPRQPEIQGCRYHEGLQAVFVDGGAAGNVVPDRATITINHRFAPDRSAAEAEAHVRELLRPVLEPEDDFEVVDVGVAAAPHLTHPLVAALCGRSDLEVRAKLGWTDVAFFAERGVAAANFGPGDAEISHTRDERIERRYLTFAYAALADLLTLGV